MLNKKEISSEIVIVVEKKSLPTNWWLDTGD